LFNRREFERRIEQALSERRRGGRPCALLYIDLDQFKLINDISGHTAGDQLLAQLALAMRLQLRGDDTLARLGGDEFGLLAFELDMAGARALAERLRTCIESQMFVWQERTYTVSASIGVVVVEHGDPTLKDLMAWADTACYVAKENGRNRVHLYSEDDEATRRYGEMEWANRLRWAMEEDRLLLDYQEIVPLDGRREEGARIELLLRLRDEDGRIVLPGAFLPAAERYGLMPMVDRWVIRTALAHLAELHAEGRALQQCAINLSGASIEDEGLADFILALISEHGIEPSCLCFEITETVAVRNLLKVVGIVERLRTVGCRIALDDFGAGMSSFGYLKSLPVDVIKIDGSFIRDLEVDAMSRTIVSAIAQIGHQRGLSVVAEWVGSATVVQALRELGVDYGQGMALHRPERVGFQRPRQAA
jgi:diguanylate cyclase (GGDEF)-like protein